MARPHHIIPRLTPQQVARFLAKVRTAASDECWEWGGHRTPENYGIWQPWKFSPRFVASRVAYFLHFGKDPAEMLVCHTCDNPPCCNPTHLFLGTADDNNRDKVLKGRGAHGAKSRPKHIARGELSHNAKLTTAIVIEIRRKYVPRKYSAFRLSREYGVSKRTVLRILHGEQWTHI